MPEWRAQLSTLIKLCLRGGLSEGRCAGQGALGHPISSAKPFHLPGPVTQSPVKTCFPFLSMGQCSGLA